MEYPVEWPKVVEKLGHELSHTKIRLVMAETALEQAGEEIERLRAQVADQESPKEEGPSL